MNVLHSGTPGRWLQEMPLTLDAAPTQSLTGRVSLSSRYVEGSGVALTVQTEVNKTISSASLGSDGTRVDILENYALGAGLARCGILP